MGEFDIIEYLDGLTAFSFDKSVYKTIARERGVLDVTSFDVLEQKQKDLLLADLYYVAYTSPTSSSSYSASHGTNKVAVGSQTINDKASIYNAMVALYWKWGDDKLLLITPQYSNQVEIIDATMGVW